MANAKLVDLHVTKFMTALSSACYAGLAAPDGTVVLAYLDSALSASKPTTASTFAPACILIDYGTAAIWVNTGTTASVTWTSLTIN